VKQSEENLKPMLHSAQNRCFGCGQANAEGLRLEFFLAGDGGVVTLPTVADRFEGHPGYLHGGIIATLLDEAMSKSARARGLTTMTRKWSTCGRCPRVRRCARKDAWCAAKGASIG